MGLPVRSSAVEPTRFKVNTVQDNSPPPYPPADYGMTFRPQMTMKEKAPSVDLYRDPMSVHNISRPSLDALHLGPDGSEKDETQKNIDLGEDGHHKKFGWIQGVLVLNVMNLWGPMLFMRTSWLVGQGGFIEALVVIAVSTLITVITALSTAAIATNGEVKAGGTYYMLSRSLGPEFGGAIGIVFSFANMVGVAMNVVGFCEAFQDLLSVWNVKIIDGDINDVRIIGCAVTVLLGVICIVGMEWEQKAQGLFFLILQVAIWDVIIGSFLPVSSDKAAKGVTGWSVTTFKNNLLPDYHDDTNFMALFSVYFPSVTGFLAGANISGELRDPQKSIPKGTLWAICITTASYIFYVVISAFCIERYTDGTIVAVANISSLSCYEFRNCTYGIGNDVNALMVVSGFKWLVYAGNFSATLSSALACLVGAPRLLQALARDKLYPYTSWFEKGYGHADDPYTCYVVSFLIAIAFILIGNLDTVASIMSNFFMAAFCLINFACFHAALSKSPGFRPSFKYWNMWVAAFGAILCFIIMFAMDYRTGLLTVVVCAILYLYIYYTQPPVNWGSSGQAETYRKALVSVQDLNRVEEHVKNYRPQILVLSGDPKSRPALIDLSQQITKGIGLVVCGDIKKKRTTFKKMEEHTRKVNRWLQAKKYKVFYTQIDNESFADGARCLIQTTGLGKLHPNVLFMGFKHNWHGCADDDVQQYFETIHDAFDMHLGVGILRMPNGLDYSYFTDKGDSLDGSRSNSLSMGNLVNGNFASVESGLNYRDGIVLGGNNLYKSNESLAHFRSPLDLETGRSPNGGGGHFNYGFSRSVADLRPGQDSLGKRLAKKNKRKAKKSDADSMDNIPAEIIAQMHWFKEKQEGNIDVWWLYDDGGLTLLIPYLLTNRKKWEKCNLRVFSLASADNNIGEEQRNLASLLHKFRIKCDHVTVLSDNNRLPSERTVREFESMIDRYRPPNTPQDSTLVITDAEMADMREKNFRYMRIRELLMEHSRGATLIVMTMPIPRKHRVSAPLYLAWLDTLTRDLPPFFLLRGNQTSVLTFYS